VTLDEAAAFVAERLWSASLSGHYPENHRLTPARLGYDLWVPIFEAWCALPAIKRFRDKITGGILMLGLFCRLDQKIGPKEMVLEFRRQPRTDRQPARR